MAGTSPRVMTAEGYLSPPPTPHHYEGNPGAHKHAIRFGMWLFLTSSLTVALAHHNAEQGKNRNAFWLLVVSVAMGGGFLGIKAIEYAEKFREGALPGRFFSFAEITAPGGPMFYVVYFFTTGLHATIDEVM